MSAKTTAISARKTVQKAINSIGMTVTRSRAPYTAPDEDGIEEVIETPDATYKAIDLSQDTMRVRIMDQLGLSNSQADNNTWGFDHLADVLENDTLVFLVTPQFVYKVVKQFVPQSIADYIILNSVQVERYVENT